MVVGISNSFYVVFGPLLAPIPNFIQIGRKTQKLIIFAIGRFWLVGLVGRKLVVAIANSFYVVFGPLLATIPNFIQIGQKTQKLKVFTIGRFWLVGLVGRKNGRRHFKLILCCFWSIIRPRTKFHPNRTENTEVENFRYWSVFDGRAGRSKNGRSHFKHSESVRRLTNDLCTKFKPNRMKIGQVSPS